MKNKKWVKAAAKGWVEQEGNAVMFVAWVDVPEKFADEKIAEMELQLHEAVAKVSD
jgi:hypothetical protein